MSAPFFLIRFSYIKHIKFEKHYKKGGYVLELQVIQGTKEMRADEPTFYPKKTMDKIKESNDIVDVISDFVPVKNYGEDIVAVCPFDKEGGYTLLISKDKQLYDCYECGASGDVFSFIMQYKNASLKEAAEYLAERSGIMLPKPMIGHIGRQEREDIFKINKEAANFYYQNMRADDKTGLNYLHGRGLTNHTIARFGNGFAQPKADALYQHLKEKGYSDDQLAQSGLISFYHGKGTDKFRNRVMCPIVDTDRTVLGFSGRIVGDGEPKYKNSPATLPFDKRTVLYGLNIAQNTHRNSMIICEGNLDVISMHQAGFDNAVASLGTAFTKEHAMILQQYTDHVHLIFDSDDAGVKAALRALPILRDQGLTTDIVHLEPYKDPDEFLKAEGPAAFESRLEHAEDSYMFDIKNTYKEYDLSNPSQTQQMLVDFAQTLLGLPEEQKDAFIQAMKDYIEHYADEGYYKESPYFGDNKMTIMQEEKSSTDLEAEDADPAATGETRIDTSWLDEYSLS